MDRRVLFRDKYGFDADDDQLCWLDDDVKYFEGRSDMLQSLANVVIPIGTSIELDELKVKVGTIAYDSELKKLVIYTTKWTLI